jgi:hypothetical protein
MITKENYLLLGLISCLSIFTATVILWSNNAGLLIVLIGTILVGLAFFKTHKKFEYPADKLVNEPAAEQILSMTFEEELLFVQTARMEPECLPDDNGNRAMIRACYLINEAYKMEK